MRSFVQCCSEWESAQRTFFAITDILAIVQREIISVPSPQMLHAPCLPAEIDGSYILAVKV